MTPSERINYILESKGLSCSAFAKQINESEQKLKDIRRGKTKGISNTIAKKIVDKFPSISMQWLITGEGEMQSKSDSELAEIVEKKNEEIRELKAQVEKLQDIILNLSKNIRPSEYDIKKQGAKLSL